ncbi:hypothetical protein [Vreelandella neptunia]|uniref:Uncharacterized protein n=1 Tax=Vreelandella neptunia TaxID=115551 RepID=A0ABZ0YKG1_9GAMM|nr:hypothetical protein [Halomonas neptunia]MDN3562403.1 hypothetical protein [Halomonas neptunia]WQH11767.1 hypothetical protein SR894_16625 [Halomonas neptunia]
MFQAFIDRITNDGTSELFYLLVGSVILFCIQQVYAGIRKTMFRRRVRSEILAYRKKKEAINVVDLATGDPEFEKRNIFSREISRFGEKRCLYINMPKHLKDELRSKEKELGYMDSQFTEFHEDTSFDGGSSFNDLVKITGIEELAKLIGKHRVLVGRKFLEATEGMIFNGDKYGVFNLRFTRFGEEENPGVEIDLFKTDYFTHRVFRSIYHELKERGHEIAKANSDTFLNYRPFFTSFGVNCLLICDGGKGKEVVLSKRSARVAGGKSKYHITMNEGLSRTDKDPFGKVDIELCFKRGLLEELGIDENIYQLAVKAAFYDFFLEMNNFEIGVSAVFELELDFEKDIAPLIARDKQLEVDSFIPLPMRKKEINKFVKENDFVPHGLYVFERVLLRKGLRVISK